MSFYSDMIVDYASNITKHWSGGSPEKAEEICAKIGQTLVEYLAELQEDRDKRLLLKTPRSRGLHNVPKLFPSAKVLILLRDGRDVCESAERSFVRESRRWWRKEWIRRWNEGAQCILEFMSTCENERGRSWELVKYEELVNNLRTELGKALSLLGVSPASYPWQDAEAAPVIGSSGTGSTQEGLNWKPKQKDDSFNSVGRWQNSWGYLRRRQFNRIAGDNMKRLGYAD